MVNLATFDLNLLRVLDALLHEGSTVRAGERLGLSQPAVSAALARLRAALGDELFFRRGNRLEATQYARSLELPLREVLDGIESLLVSPRDFDPMQSDARFRISGTDFFAELLMPQLAEVLSRQAPRMRVHLVGLVPDSYPETIETYDVDLALIPRTDLPGWIDSQWVFDSGFVVIARNDHPRLRRAGVQQGQVIPLDLFCDIGQVFFSLEGGTRGLGDAALAAVGRERQVVMTLPSFSGVYRAVAGSDLIALLPVALARHVAGSVGLSLYAPPMKIAKGRIDMIWHRRYTNSPSHRWLRERVAEILAPLNDVT